MAATDLLLEVGDPGTATTLSAPGYTSGGTSINVGSTTGWPSAGKGVIFAIDEAEIVDGEEVQVEGTYNEYEGTVATATSISNVDWVRGVGDRNYSAGALTRVYISVSSERENRLVEWGSVQHKVDGTHANTITTDTINENTAANGVTVDSLNIKDGKLNTNNSVVTSNLTDDSVTDAKRPRMKFADVSHSTTQSINNNTWTSALFDTETTDPEGWHSTVTNTSRVTVAEAGLYSISGGFRIPSVATGNLVGGILAVNGTQLLDTGNSFSSATGAEHINVHTQIVLAANDYVEMQALQVSGASANIDDARLTVVKLSD